MLCPKCGHDAIATNSYPSGGQAMARRRECRHCNWVCTTIEVITSEEPKRGEGAGSVYKRLRERETEVRKAVNAVLEARPVILATSQKI